MAKGPIPHGNMNSLGTQTKPWSELHVTKANVGGRELNADSVAGLQDLQQCLSVVDGMLCVTYE